MAQSLSNVIIHVVFSTKHRTPWLHKPLRPRLHAYMATLVRGLERCDCFIVNGVEDHVHLAIRLSRTISIAKLVEKVKTSSSRWVKEQEEALKDFAWQGGYFAESVKYRELETLVNYINRQEEHHQRIEFQEEYRNLLIESGVEFDEQYMWD
jgi:putative transposase